MRMHVCVRPFIENKYAYAEYIIINQINSLISKIDTVCNVIFQNKNLVHNLLEIDIFGAKTEPHGPLKHWALWYTTGSMKMAALAEFFSRSMGFGFLTKRPQIFKNHVTIQQSNQICLYLNQSLVLCLNNIFDFYKFINLFKKWLFYF